MTKETFRARYRDEMACVRVSPQLKRKTLDRINQKEEIVMKKKLSAALVFMLVLMICAIALAAATKLGILDFAARTTRYIPEDAQDYVQSDVLHMENDLVTVELSELYYDGLVSRMTVNVKPKTGKILLLGEDVWMDDPWINMTPMEAEFDKIYTETVLDVYRKGGYEAAYSAIISLRVDGDEALGGTGNHHWNEDGTLTLYQQWEYSISKPQREAVFSLTLFPYADTLDQLDIDGRIDLVQPITLNQNDYTTQTYQSTAPVDFPTIGVRVDRFTLEVRAQEIHAIIDYTVTDEQTYASLESGLWFEIIDPNSTETEPYLQRLKEGLSGGGMAAPTDDSSLHYRQIQTLGRNELHDVYTLRAYSAWDKTRFEIHSIPIELAE